jgi:hemoglobin
MEQTLVRQTAFELIGGKSVVQALVDRFYDLMDTESAYRELRALHAPDLTPMRASLTGFLVAWLGGPRDWFDERPGRCVMSAHRDVAMTEASTRQWADAMTRAIIERVPEAELAQKMAEALASMALNMGGVTER